MKQLTPLRMILLGFVLLVLGFVLPFSMLLQILPSTLPLNFVSRLSLAWSSALSGSSCTARRGGGAGTEVDCRL
ncbi:MAG: hypothetical protein FJZ89_01895 [Chloroflexi bacterium]|nr:hypothetical protein [Chloroflexota bacterium]